MKRSLEQLLSLRSIAIGVFSLFWIVTLNAGSCVLTTTVNYATTDDIKAFFESQKRDVVTFLGYSGSGYEDKATMLETAGRILYEFDPSKIIVNIGGTPEGIGSVYELARQRGFRTTGIVSTQAKKFNAQLSHCVDYVFYVGDATWGGFIDGGDRLSPTSKAMVENSDVLIGIGGGEIARDELLAAKRAGKEVRFFPADVNHKKAREKAKKNGLPAPTNFGGAAGEVFAPYVEF